MKNRGILIVLSGPAGTGKGTICKEFLKKNPDTVLSVSATTRSPRPGEQHGMDYYFTTRDDFEKMIAQNGFLEYAEFCENYYGTPIKAVNDKLDEGMNVILEIEVQGAMQIKEKKHDAVFVFIAPPSKKILRERIEGRGTETPAVIEKRMLAAETELKQISNYDYIIVNDDVESAVKRFEAIKEAESYKTTRNEEFIREVCR
ncbi:MAG: guanylate kinase [Bacillota bacterium]|nr:guanylate kinase [Bacillota bacterium]